MYKEIDKPCPACGMIGVWICSDRNCPKSGDQKAVRDRWIELSRENPEENGEKSGN